MTIISLPVNKTASTVTVPNGGTATSGQIYTTTSTNAIWTNSTTIPNETIRINQTNPPTIEVKGNMVINGRDLEVRLSTIEKLLHIPERVVKIEKKHPKLK